MHPTFLETLISKYDFGSVKLPGAPEEKISPALGANQIAGFVQ